MSSVRRHRNRSAFTLIELLLVLVILSVLAGIVVVNFTHVYKETRGAKIKADLHEMGTALELYRVNCGEYPPALEALLANPGTAGWDGPYINHGLPVDPWSHAYVYACPGQHNPKSFDLSTNGDGKMDVTLFNNWTAEAPK